MYIRNRDNYSSVERSNDHLVLMDTTTRLMCINGAPADALDKSILDGTALERALLIHKDAETPADTELVCDLRPDCHAELASIAPGLKQQVLKEVKAEMVNDIINDMLMYEYEMEARFLGPDYPSAGRQGSRLGHYGGGYPAHPVPQGGGSPYSGNPDLKALCPTTPLFLIVNTI